ncbi:hypothetical protein ACJ73_02539 [Blastomyces percursus]|uniref:Uncharacterized protein n=1 Tax=Blastomyces percursus TaxID=1658174 RepID=A0A1J9QB76_9EURO|nr:hypothetical protein ACJ73_02539 [Blastomyces percursus]
MKKAIRSRFGVFDEGNLSLRYTPVLSKIPTRDYFGNMGLRSLPSGRRDAALARNLSEISGEPRWYLQSAEA